MARSIFAVVLTLVSSSCLFVGVFHLTGDWVTAAVFAVALCTALFILLISIEAIIGSMRKLKYK